MTPPIGFRTNKTADEKGSLIEIHPTAIATPGSSNSRAADYAYRIAALTAGLVLLATVM